jgi:hypothetical protein
VMSLDEFIQLITSDITHKTVVWANQLRLHLIKTHIALFTTVVVEEFLKD